MRKYNNIVLRQMDIGFQSVCADFHRPSEGAHCVLWMLILEPSVRNCLWNLLAIFFLLRKSPAS